MNLDITFEELMERMLAQVPSTMDKREGSVIWDAIAPVAVEFQNVYIALKSFLDESFADTASLPYLERRAAERGITRELATNAILQGEFTPVDLEIPIGSRFSCEKLNYTVTEKVSDGVYKLSCETAGTDGNENLGSLIPIDYIAGLQTATLTKVLINGTDDETVEELRERYFESLNSQAFGGNVADYKQKVHKISPDIGGVKVTPVWKGGGTVKLTIQNSEFGAPSTDLVTLIQKEADPIGHGGEGLGFAPIGHIVTVVGVETVTVDIVTNIVYESGWNWESCKSYILKAIDDYFKDASEAWEDTDTLIVRISQLEAKILACAGVLDISGTTVNGSSSNLTLADDKIPVRGTVNGTKYD